eukprot:GCRY01002031.1.p1 GENE.GCRY01002031.1~~GCRY01002031.1.p1  ORF type:complete len:141 (-),score=23.82 GCRY01002031.1:125-547(-)
MSEGLKEEEFFLEAAKRGDAESLQDYLTSSVNITFTDTLGNSALHWASSAGHLDCVMVLLKSKAFDVNSTNNLKETPLHAASWRMRAEVVKALLAAGADSSATNADGKTPLDLIRDDDTSEVFQAYFAENGTTGDDSDSD